MSDDFRLDARGWRFLNHPASYAKSAAGALQLDPLQRQFRTAKEILARLVSGRGVLLADDVGLGKTTVAALVAWVLACQGKRVRIYAPNVVMRRRWAEELERHIPMLAKKGARRDLIKQGDIEKLHAGRIQVATHRGLIRSHQARQQRSACDLMIIDEAHRAKGEGSVFNQALGALGAGAKRKLILTATPMSIDVDELARLLEWVGATDIAAVRDYAEALQRLYRLGAGHDMHEQAARLVTAATAAIDALSPYLIRHGIEDLSPAECRHFGTPATKRWNIGTPTATPEELTLLLRMDRILQLAPERKGERRIDPRFHIGWRHLQSELDRAASRSADPVTIQHVAQARLALVARLAAPHPKIEAVSAAIRQVVQSGEKVLVFCHHRASASELLSVLEQSLKFDPALPDALAEGLWRGAWQDLLADDDPLVMPLIDWLCTPGLRRQVTQWLGKPACTRAGLVAKLKVVRPRHAPAGVCSIAEAAQALKKNLLDAQSTSTRAVLRNMQTDALGESRFPGDLDQGYRVMGFWDPETRPSQPHTLYTGRKEPDIVLALFNSPFGPDVLVATDRLSEGVDLHRYCRHLIHYELDPSPVRTLQRNGRVRRVGAWAAQTERPICYAYPLFAGTRDEKAVNVMVRRLQNFGLLLGGVPTLEADSPDDQQNFADAVLRLARQRLSSLNGKLTVHPLSQSDSTVMSRDAASNP